MYSMHIYTVISVSDLVVLYESVTAQYRHERKTLQYASESLNL
jgi:hypothetical protein